MNNKVLYITYDGLTDPLGQSQIIPYLAGLTSAGYDFTILSFEKKERMMLHKDTIRAILAPFSIKWVPLVFTTKPPLLSKYYDAIRMKRKAFSLQRKNRFALVHCRSYIAADAGLALKKKFGIRFLFDMRGFWADEKKDGLSWNQDKMIFRVVYRYYKKKEKQYLEHADGIISLTHAGKSEMMNWDVKHLSEIEVIPCCADMDHFTLRSDHEKIKSRQKLNIPLDRLVVTYLGSLGAWYMLDEMLHLFSVVQKKYPASLFLFISHSDTKLITSRLPEFGIKKEDVKILEASRNEVPVFMKASDISVSFIKPVYSKMSSSPTKIGEILAMGIPVICNEGIGDITEILEDARVGATVKDFNAVEYEKVVVQIPSLLQLSPGDIREHAKKWFDLKKGVELYGNVYQKIFDGIQVK